MHTLKMKAEDYLKSGKVIVWKEVFAVIKSKKTFEGAFANIMDKNEITVIIDQVNYKKEDVIKIEIDWKLLTFDVVLPFGLVGFLATVSKVLADGGIPIFAVSAYSTDHILVKLKDLEKAKQELRKLGCIIVES